MTGYRTFLGKELSEFVHTWRVWVLGAITAFLALSGPPLAKLTPVLLRSLNTGGLRIDVPTPTWVDSYAQWTKNLTGMLLIALVISLGGVVASELKAGTAVLMLTKPLSRRAFVLAKLTAHTLTLTVLSVVGAVATWLLTLGVFGHAPIRPVAESTLAWLVLGALIVAVMVDLSILTRNALAAAGAGFGFYVLISLLDLWGPAVRHSLVGLPQVIDRLGAGAPAAPWQPVVTSLALTLIVIWDAERRFGRAEL